MKESERRKTQSLRVRR